jgi:lysyl-tRNA synthetase class 2
LFAQSVGIAMNDHAAVRARWKQSFAARPAGDEAVATIDPDTAHPDVLISELFEEFAEPHLGRGTPVFCLDYPAAVCPLTKRKRDNPALAERFELFIDGMEIANAYTELNDPRLQDELFRTQLAGLAEEASMARMDHDFIRALKVGMPPAGGLGIGIDRLVMLLTNSPTIRDVIFFPLLRPES